MVQLNSEFGDPNTDHEVKTDIVSKTGQSLATGTNTLTFTLPVHDVVGSVSATVEPSTASDIASIDAFWSYDGSEVVVTVENSTGASVTADVSLTYTVAEEK